MPCFKIKIIDLASFTFLKDIDLFGIKKNSRYPKIYTSLYCKEECLKRLDVLD